MNKNNVLEVKNLSKKFGPPASGFTAVNDISFSIEDVEILGFLAVYVSGKSTRVNLAKAFSNFPKILLLDEPTASLDVDIAADMRKFLLEERKEFHTSMLFTSHNMAEIEEICDRVIFINKGKIIADDTPENLA